MYKYAMYKKDDVVTVLHALDGHVMLPNSDMLFEGRLEPLETFDEYGDFIITMMIVYVPEDVEFIINNDMILQYKEPKDE